MINVQKVIKYCAIAFAIVLIVNIVFGILSLVVNVGGLFDNNNVYDKPKLVSLESTALEDIDIALNASSLIIKPSDIFKVSVNSDNLTVKENNNKLTITERKLNVFGTKGANEVIVYVPGNANLDNVDIESGAGKVIIDSLTSNRLDLELGAGKVEINNINVLKEANLDGGAGEVEIKDSIINNLEFDIGIGSTYINSKLNGKNKISAGIGKVDIDLIGSENDYSFSIDKGVGSITVNNQSVSNKYSYGTGNNTIDIEGGVGSINIKTTSN